MPEALCRICAISADRVLRSPMRVAAAFMSLVGEVARAAEQASSAERYYVIRIGDKSPHLHFHLVPRVEGETSLAPHIFGNEGWVRHVRADAAPPAELVESARCRALRLEAITHRSEEDARRLPAWLVGLAISMTAGMVTLLALAPFTTGLLLTALPIGVMMATTSAVKDRMAGEQVRWRIAAACGAVASGISCFMIGWLRG